MAEVIITEFRADTAQFTAAIDAAEASVVGLDKSEKDAQKSTAALTQQLGSAAGKASAHKVAMGEVAKATTTAATGTAALGKALAATDFDGASAESKALASVLLSFGDQGQSAFDALNLSAEGTISVLRELIAEASKTPQGAAALSTELNEAQQAALSTLQTMGALTAEEAETVAQAVKLGAAQTQVSEETKDTAKEYTSLRAQMRKAKEELDRVVDASDGKITPELIAAAKKAGELNDRMGDLSATIAAFNPDAKFAAFSGVITNLAGGFTAVQGAMALLGGESESVQKGLLKVQSALAVSQGLQSLFGGLKDNLANLKLVLASSTTGAISFSGALAGARAAMLSLNTAIAANPIGAALVAVVALGAALYALSSSINEVEINAEGLTDVLERLVDIRSEKLQAGADLAAFDRELALSEELLTIEQERAKVRASKASPEQKALKEQLLADRAAAAERKKALADATAADAIATQTALDSGNKRLSVENALSEAYKKTGATFIAQSKLQGKVLEDAANLGVNLGVNEKRALEQRRILVERLGEEEVKVLEGLEADREKFAQQEAEAFRKSGESTDKIRLASRQSDIELTKSQARQSELRAKAAEAEAERTKAIADKRAAAERAVADVIREIDQFSLNASLDDREKRDAAVRASFDKQIETTRAAFAELSKTSTSDTDRAAIAQREADAVIAIEEAKGTEIMRLREEDITAARDFAKTEEQIQAEAINKKFDLQKEETIRLIETEEERTKILKEIEQKRVDELGAIRTAAEEKRAAEQQARFDVELNALGSFAEASSALLLGMARGNEDAAKNFAKASVGIAFDAVNAMVPIWVAQATAGSLIQPDSVATFGASGLARAAVLTALIKGVLAGLRGTLGFAEGGEVTKGSGPKVRRSNGDNVLATLQDREIVLSRASRARAERVFGKGVWGELGVPGFGGSIDWTQALAKIGSANGPRDGGTVVSSRDDRRIIGALGGVGSLREQRKQTELLEEMARIRRGRNPRSRWA